MRVAFIEKYDLTYHNLSAQANSFDLFSRSWAQLRVVGKPATRRAGISEEVTFFPDG
jgi:hypothetical protein